MTMLQEIIIVAVVAAGTILTRFLPFLIFPENKKTPKYVEYLGRVLPYSAMGLLVVYCLKDTGITAAPYGVPEGAALLATAALHIRWKNLFLSVAAGTLVYMLLIRIL